MIKHEKHIDNKEKTSENPDEFLCSLVKSLKIRFLYPIKKVHENAIIQNEKPQKAEKRYLWTAITRTFPVISIQKQSLEVFYKTFAHNNLKNLQENTCVGVFFK